MITENKKLVAEVKPEGDGAQVKRLFPTSEFSHLDPFVLLDEFSVEAPNRFSKHEHRGFEAITYMLSGSFVHEDNLGNKSKVKAGGIQSFNAGKGIKHSEAPGEEEGHSHGIQLWVNLPREEKQSEPVYQKFSAGEIPEQEDKNLKIRTIAGPGSKLELRADIIFQDVELKQEADYNIQLDRENQAVIYMIEGEIRAEENLQAGEGFILAPQSELEVKGIDSSSRFIFLAGKPLDQQIEIQGSFVK